jgi:hypothetical protein
MMGTVLKTSGNKVNQHLQNPVRDYASFAGKSKLTKETKSQFSKEDIKTVVNNHAQYITDFNLIYENPEEILLYQIGTLHTTPVTNSHNISQEENYLGDKSIQQINFFKTPIRVNNDVHFIKKSMQYFNNKEVKTKVETNDMYKLLFDQVLEELKRNNIKYKIASTQEEMQYTGLNILGKLKSIQENPGLFDNLLSIKNDKE